MKVEPNADMRAFAIMLCHLYVALTDEGFTESQALTVIGEVISANFKDIR